MFNAHKIPFFSFKMMYLLENLTYFKCFNSQFNNYVSDGTHCIKMNLARMRLKNNGDLTLSLRL